MPKPRRKPAAKMSNTTALEDMVRMLVEERASCEEEIVTERKLRQAEMEQREKLVTAQMQQMRDHMQALMDVATSKEKAPPPRNSLEVKLVPLSAKDDIEAYLVTFERVMQAHEIPENRWAIHLAPQLTGKAQLAYAAVSPADVGDYSAVKAAILARYDINTEAYRRQFRTATRGREESFRELSIRLMDLQNK